MKPLGKIKLDWSPKFAYAIGLLTTDGNLSPDGRHIEFTSNDGEQLIHLKKCLGLKNKIGTKMNGAGTSRSMRIEFGDVYFYQFLFRVGLSPHKSKALRAIAIPNPYFFDFLRGHFDGDGSFYSYFDPRWKASFMFYITFISASSTHIDWLRKQIEARVGIRGHINKTKSIFQLRYAKAESLKLLPKLYYNRGVVCLSRKREKIRKALLLSRKYKICAGGEIGRHATLRWWCP